MIKINNIFKTYKSKKSNDCSALKNINLTLNDTGLVFIIGKSGSGKTTLLNILGGLDKPDNGYLVINGKSTENFSDKDYDCYRNTYVGFIFQEFNLLESLNVEENINFSSQLLNKKINKNKVNDILKLVGLEGLNNRNINELSGGQRQRVAIARILNKDCKYIFADEPTGNLDTKVGKQIFDLLKKLSKTRLVVVVSHDKENANNYADRIIEIKNGEVISDISRISKKIIDDFHYNEKGELLIPSSRPLTSKEIKKLNLLLKKDIKKVKSIPKQFKKTKPMTEKEEKEFTNKNPKMSFKSTLKFAFSNIKVKMSRFIMIIFILTMALTLLGLSSFFSEFDGNVATINTFSANGVDKLIVNQGKYNTKINQLENVKTVFTNKDFITEYSEVIGNNYLESRNILINRPIENTLAQSLTDIENGYQINSEKDLEKVNYSILNGTFKENSKDLGYVNLMITDVTWYIHCKVESSLLTQALNSSTVHKFKEFVNDDLKNLNEESKNLIENILAKIDGSNGTIIELSNLEKSTIFSLLCNNKSLMDFVLYYFENNVSWNSSNVLYKITGIVNTGMSNKEKQTLDSIISKNDQKKLTDEEKALVTKVYQYYSKVFGDLKDISGIRSTYIYSRSGSRISIANNINNSIIYPTSYETVSYNHFYKYDQTTHFIGANAGKDLLLRNGYDIGSINTNNNYEILAPITNQIIQRPTTKFPSINDSIVDVPSLGMLKENNKKIDIPLFPGIQIKPIRQKGLLNNDIILEKDVFSSLFGTDAINRYFISPSTEDEKVDLMIYFKLAEEAEPLKFRVVGIANGGGIEIMLGTDGLNTLMLDNNICDSYLIQLSNNINENIKTLELLEKHHSFHVSEISTIMYRTISVFSVFELIFVGLTMILIIFVIILISNFMNTAITKKTKEIGLLRALGVTKHNVDKIFLYESLLIGFISSILAIIISVLSVTPINELILLSLPKFFGTTLSIEISLLSFNYWMIPTMIAISILSCIISTIIPTHKIGKIKPSESMRAINK